MLKVVIFWNEGVFNKKKCNDDILVKHKNILPLSKKKRQPKSE